MGELLQVLMAAEEMGLLDCVAFSSSLSGSAWLQVRFHMETLIIYTLGLMKFTTQNDLY